MNERIKLLAEQCTVSCIDGRGVELNEIDVEKFAELIVGECGKWIVDNAGAIENLGPKYFAQAMIKDFGVDE